MSGRSSRRRSKSAFGVPATLAIIAFGVLLCALVATRRASPWIFVPYAAMSLVCAITYLVDKSAATRQRHRVSERSLLMLGLFCGWPGGLIAQRVLRHKTSKPSFQWRFRATVLLNVVTLTVLCLWRTILR